MKWGFWCSIVRYHSRENGAVLCSVLFVKFNLVLDFSSGICYDKKEVWVREVVAASAAFLRYTKEE